MSGQVSWVGSSSLIIHMKLTRESDSVDVLAANFTFVARDIMSGKSCCSACRTALVCVGKGRGGRMSAILLGHLLVPQARSTA